MCVESRSDPKGSPTGRGRGWTLAALGVAFAVGVALWLVQRNEARAAELARLEEEVAALLVETRADTLVPGLSAGFVLGDGRVGVAVTGWADVEDEEALTPDHRFLAGSLGKSLHAALALALDRDGALDLDAPIAHWLGSRDWFARLPNGPDLTLRHLLQHRSGLSDHLFTLEFWVRSLLERLLRRADARLGPEELVEIALDREPKFAAGEGFAYGDTNYVLAGLVIEAATGRSPFDQIEERFVDRLGLDGLVAARTRRVPRLAAGYQLPVNAFLLPPKIAVGGELGVHPMNESTAGGFAGTPRDLARWAWLLFEERALPGRYLDALVGESVEAGDGRRYGLGVYLYETPLGPAWGHSGYFPGYRSALRYFPDHGIAVCVQANRDVLIDLDALVLEIAQRLAAAER